MRRLAEAVVTSIGGGQLTTDRGKFFLKLTLYALNLSEEKKGES